MILDKAFLEELDGLKQDMRDTNSDLVISIYGKEGSGKSTLALNLAKYLDETFNADNLSQKTAQTFEDFARKAPKTESFQVVWWDEAHRFSKRGAYDTQLNRILLEYFQDIRGAKRIYILCYPELKEIDRKVVQRSRLFLETIKKGRQFYTRAWSAEQIEAKFNEMRVFSYDSRQKVWTGIPRKAIRIFKCNFKGIEKELEAYKRLKESSLIRSDYKLSTCGMYDTIDIINEILKRTGYKYAWKTAEKAAYASLHKAIDLGFSEEEITKTPSGYGIKSDQLFENMVKDALSNLNPESILVQYRNINIERENIYNKEGEKTDGKNQLLAESQV